MILTPFESQFKILFTNITIEECFTRKFRRRNPSVVGTQVWCMRWRLWTISYGDVEPKQQEDGGKYGKGIITAQYQPGLARCKILYFVTLLDVNECKWLCSWWNKILPCDRYSIKMSKSCVKTKYEWMKKLFGVITSSFIV